MSDLEIIKEAYAKIGILYVIRRAKHNAFENKAHFFLVVCNEREYKPLQNMSFEHFSIDCNAIEFDETGKFIQLY